MDKSELGDLVNELSKLGGERFQHLAEKYVGVLLDEVKDNITALEKIKDRLEILIPSSDEYLSEKTSSVQKLESIGYGPRYVDLIAREAGEEWVGFIVENEIIPSKFKFGVRRILSEIREAKKSNIGLDTLLKNYQGVMTPVRERRKKKIVVEAKYDSSAQRLRENGYGKIYCKKIAGEANDEIINFLIDNQIIPKTPKFGPAKILDLIQKVNSGEYKLEELLGVYQNILRDKRRNGGEISGSFYIKKVKKLKENGYKDCFSALAKLLNEKEVNEIIEKGITPQTGCWPKIILDIVRYSKDRGLGLDSTLVKYTNLIEENRESNLKKQKNIEKLKENGYNSCFNSLTDILGEEGVEFLVENEIFPTDQISPRRILNWSKKFDLEENKFQKLLNAYFTFNPKQEIFGVDKLRKMGYERYSRVIAKEVGKEGVEFLIENGIVPEGVGFSPLKILRKIKDINWRNGCLNELLVHHNNSVGRGNVEIEWNNSSGDYPGIEILFEEFSQNQEEGIKINLDTAAKQLMELKFDKKYADLFVKRYPLYVAAIIEKGENPNFYGGISSLNLELKMLEGRRRNKLKKDLERSVNSSTKKKDVKIKNNVRSLRGLNKQRSPESQQVYKTVYGPSNSSIKAHLERIGYSRDKAKELFKINRDAAIFLALERIAPKEDLSYETIKESIEGNELAELRQKHRDCYVNKGVDLFGKKMPSTHELVNRLKGLGYSNNESLMIAQQSQVRILIREGITPIGSIDSPYIKGELVRGNIDGLVRMYFREREKLFDPKMKRKVLVRGD